MANAQKIIKGIVVSDKMANTAIIEITKFIVHPLYKKRMTRKKKFVADNALGAKTGQKVIILECRPLSKTKHWRITEILQ